MTPSGLAALAESDRLPISSLASPANEKMIRRYLAALTGNVEAVDDLSQEVFLRAIQRIDRLPSGEDPARFLRGIARRVAHEFFRRFRRGKQYLQSTLDLLAAEDSCVAEALQHRETLDSLRVAIEDLPIISRRMLELRYHDGKSAAQIGVLLELQPTAVRVTLMRIRERLRVRVGLVSILT